MYNIDENIVLSKLDVNLSQGLNNNEVTVRRERDGANVLNEKKPPSLLIRFLEQFKDLMIIILLIAAGVSYIVSGHATDSIVILLVVLVNAIIGVSQESKAEKSLEALKKMSAPSAKVLRNGSKGVVPSADIVVGDIIFVEAGDLIPADARIIENAALKVEESALTGESVPVEKQSGVIMGENIPIGDRKNMLYSGTVATYGRATAVVTAIGMATESGKIADAIMGETDEMTPLQKRLAQIGNFLGILAVVICGAIFAIGMANGDEFITIFMTAVSLAVAAVPEGLPAIVTLVLAMGVQRLVKRNAIIRKLPAVETLGSASVVCSDKTGTLTMNQMTITELYTQGKHLRLKEDEKTARELLSYATLCCDAQIVKGSDGIIQKLGDPTEIAMVAALIEVGESKELYDTKYPRIGEIPFDSDRKLMTTVHKDGERIFSVTKGAPDRILAISHLANHEEIMAVNKQMADKALRVLAVGIKELTSVPSEFTSELLESGLEFVGLMGMIDPPREEAKLAVATCKTAGITPVMITGDHKDTAVAIARELGILTSDEQAISGVELDLIDDTELLKQIENLRVYARVSPEHKIRIVKAWKQKGQVVAMTGDGVNDAPALKAADIGCAMGITGTEVSKGAADMILTDDNFATIPAAVEEGRGIYQNIKKCISFLLSSNLGEVMTIFFAMLAGIGTPLLPTQILWVNLITDSLPALALGVEPLEGDVMQSPPVPADEGFFTKDIIIKIVLMGGMISALTLFAYCLGLFILPETSYDIAQTMAFMTLAVGQLFHAFNLKSDKSLFTVGAFTNKYLVMALGGGLILQAIIYFVPFLASVFNIVTLPPLNLLWVLILAIAPIPIMETAKFIAKSFK